MSTFSLSSTALQFLLLIVVVALKDGIVVEAQNNNGALDRRLDRFSYDGTNRETDHVDYGPPDWDKVQCQDLDTCVRC